jgi:uncharacterized phage protein (TIGR02220 family)
MKDAYYFSHDSNARHDPKILEMLSVYGMEGYGWYWVLIEMLRDQENYKLKVNGKYSSNAYAMQLHTDSNTVKKYIDDCINEFELFESDDTYFWSESLVERMEFLDDKRQKARKAALKRWKNEGENADAMQTHSERNASKVKESKVNKSKVKNIYKDVIDYLNQKTNSNYKHTTKKTQDLIKARVNEKFTIDDFKTVIDKKIKSWTGTEWEKYLRPETLFGTKFESYLNEKVIEKNNERKINYL